jgi:hypothetical protein
VEAADPSFFGHRGYPQVNENLFGEDMSTGARDAGYDVGRACTPWKSLPGLTSASLAVFG